MKQNEPDSQIILQMMQTYAKICKMILPIVILPCRIMSSHVLCTVAVEVSGAKVFGVPEGKYKEMRDDFEAAAGAV